MGCTPSSHNDNNNNKNDNDSDNDSDNNLTRQDNDHIRDNSQDRHSQDRYSQHRHSHDRRNRHETGQQLTITGHNHQQNINTIVSVDQAGFNSKEQAGFNSKEQGFISKEQAGFNSKGQYQQHRQKEKSRRKKGTNGNENENPKETTTQRYDDKNTTYLTNVRLNISYAQDNVFEKDQDGGSPYIKFGQMCLSLPSKIKILLVFEKSDAQYDTLKWAAEKVGYQVSNAQSIDSAIDCYSKHLHHLVIVDSRSINGNTLNPISLIRSIKSKKESEFTCFVGVVKKGWAEKQESGVLSLIKFGFNRWFIESTNFNLCYNELIQLKHNEVLLNIKLRSTQAISTALEHCKDGIIVTGPNHDVQFVNQSIEKILGFKKQDLIGKNIHDIHRCDMSKIDLVDSINMQINQGKEWEGTIYHRRKSGESIPLWNKIIPVEIQKNNIDYIIYINEFPYYLIEKRFSTDTDVIPLTYGSIRNSRKASCDVKSLCSEVGLGRRQSFAKFHALTIEAPITKVINILMATQENSPVFVAQALDKVLDILKNSELYSPQFPYNQSINEDQMTNDLFTGLISGAKQSGVRRMSHETASTKSSLGLSPSTPTQLPSLANAPPNIKLLLDNQLDWSFDIIELERITFKRPLVWLGLSILSSFNVCTTINCDEITLRNWLTVIEANYHDNPYHNSTHAADVLQATAYFLCKPRLKAIFDPIDQAISLIAAIIHDIDHPGKNSAFLCNSDHSLAILYNDISVLESHHLAHAFKLTINQNDGQINIFKNLDRETYRDIRASIIDMVLATEMTKHFEHLSKFLNLFTKKSLSFDEGQPSGLPMDQQQYNNNILQTISESPDMSVLSLPENIVLIKRMLIKCADVSNPVRPLKLCEIWANRISEEYCSQTDEEKFKGLPVVMPTFDRATCSIPKSQIGFIDYFANDMFEAWDAFGDFPEIINHLRFNYQHWKVIVDKSSPKTEQQQQQQQQQQQNKTTGTTTTNDNIKTNNDNTS